MNTVIIILNYKNKKLTCECVHNLRAVGITSDILVVDNHSEDGAYGYFKSELRNLENVMVCETPHNGGYSYGNNYGIHYLEKEGRTYDAICIMNPDIQLEKADDFNRIVEALEEDDVAVATGLQSYNGMVLGSLSNYWRLPTKRTGIVDHSFLDYLCKPCKPYAIYAGTTSAYVDVVSGCFFVVKYEVLKSVGYFDESVFLFYEENILAAKLKNRDLKEVICLDAVFQHNHVNFKESTWRSNMRSRIVTIKSRSYFYRTYVTNNPINICLMHLFNGVDYILSALLLLGLTGYRKAKKHI